jgi:hypothetical protein
VTDLPVGTRVTYDDEPDPPQIVGVIAEPTAEELAYAETFGGGGPADGDVLVRWSQQERWDSSWVQPEDLRVVDTKQRLADSFGIARGAFGNEDPQEWLRQDRDSWDR